MSQYENAIARIQDIEARLGMFERAYSEPPAASAAPIGTPGGVKSAVLPGSAGFANTPVGSGPLVSSNPGAGGTAGTGGVQQPFNLALAQATGSVQLQPMGKGGPPFAPYVESLIAKYAAQNSVPPELVRAVIRTESDGNPRDVSHAGARGLMQLMPEEIHELGVTDAFDPEQNVAAGTRLLAGLLKQYKGDTPLALAAYNAGSGAVAKYKGIPPYKETQNYVRKIMGMLEK